MEAVSWSRASWLLWVELSLQALLSPLVLSRALLLYLAAACCEGLLSQQRAFQISAGTFSKGGR